MQAKPCARPSEFFFDTPASEMADKGNRPVKHRVQECVDEYFRRRLITHAFLMAEGDVADISLK